jgi:hypothetical protein
MKRMILPAYMASTAYQLRNLPSECSLGKSRSVEDSTKRSFRLGLEICPPPRISTFGKASAAAVYDPTGSQKKQLISSGSITLQLTKHKESTEETSYSAQG